MVAENEAVAVDLAELTFDDVLSDSFVVSLHHAAACSYAFASYSDCNQVAFCVTPDQDMAFASLDPSDLTPHRC